METTMQTIRKVSILGLGQMGKKLVQLYLEAGYEVTVWNRTKEKALGLRDVYIAANAEEAITASPISILIVYDNKGTSEIISSVADQNVFADKLLVNFTTGSPKEATELEEFIAAKGGYYLNGAIQVAPDQMGLKSTTILISGNETAFGHYKPVLDILAGNLKHLGKTAAASSAMDLATLTWLYGSYIGLIYGVKLSQEYGLKLEDYSQIIGEITPGFTEFFQYEIDVIKRGDFTISQSPLPISIAATERISNAFKALNVLQDFPETLKSILKEADRKGLGKEELAAIIKVIGKQV